VAYTEPARTAPRRIHLRRLRVAGLLVVVVAIGAALGSRSPGSSTSSTSASPVGVAADAPRGPLGEADGAVPDGVTVFDDAVPGVAKLDPALLDALRQAATAAQGDGVAFVVDSGWRSPEYQERLLQEAISEYGSAAEAARWVASPDTSEHVSGDAVDLGRDGAAWLSEHGAAYGLCRIYGNESWHYELRPEAVDRGCPPTYADPTHDPRMHR
jgi:D-alanyl-D-alanine carboxypeptidase